MPTRTQREIAMELIRRRDCECLLTCEEVSAILARAGKGEFDGMTFEEVQSKFAGPSVSGTTGVRV